MRSLTMFQWLGAAVTTQLVVAAGVTGFGSIESSPDDTKVLGVSVAKDAAKNKQNGEDKKDLLAEGMVEGLYPGAVLDVPITLRNPNNFDVVVSELAAGVAHASTACGAVHVDVDDFVGRRFVPANGSAVQPLVVRMHNDAPDACKNATWNLRFSGRAEKDKP